MGDPPFDCGVESDGKGSAEPDGRKGDVSCGDITCDCTVTVACDDQSVEHRLRRGSSLGPLGGVEQRVDDVDDAKAGVDGGVHVPAQGFAPGRRLGHSGLALVDRAVEHIENHRVKQRLFVRKMSVEGADTDTSSICDCITRRLTADLEDQLDGRVEESSSAPSSVSSHWPFPIW